MIYPNYFIDLYLGMFTSLLNIEDNRWNSSNAQSATINTRKRIRLES